VGPVEGAQRRHRSKGPPVAQMGFINGLLFTGPLLAATLVATARRDRNKNGQDCARCAIGWLRDESTTTYGTP
jgi:hypothetical protein